MCGCAVGFWPNGIRSGGRSTEQRKHGLPDRCEGGSRGWCKTPVPSPPERMGPRGSGWAELTHRAGLGRPRGFCCL